MSDLDIIQIGVDEYEAIRLADLQGLYQDKAAEEMGISRQTFGRIIESARMKIAQAIVEGKALMIEGGDYQIMETRKFQCVECGHTWEMPYGVGKPAGCPHCTSANIHRAEDDRGQARRCGSRGHRRGMCHGQQTGE